MKDMHERIPDEVEVKCGNRLLKFSKILLALSVVFFALVIYIVVAGPRANFIAFDGHTYKYVEFPADIFYYDLKNGGDFEQGEMYHLDGGQWEMAYCDGDIYCIRGKSWKANKYYNDNDNYIWNVIIETDDIENSYSIEISKEDSDYIYNMENMNKNTAIFFDEIETQGSLIKVSKDGFIEGRTGLAEYDGKWYWRTETIDENRERDGEWPEYVIPLPDAVSDEIMESGAQ